VGTNGQGEAKKFQRGAVPPTSRAYVIDIDREIQPPYYYKILT